MFVISHVVPIKTNFRLTNHPECPGNKQCFSGTPCKTDEETSDTNLSPETSKETDSSSASASAVDEVTSKFFCGASWEELVENCDTAKPCPSGTNAECEGGSCFANTPCGKADASNENEGATGVGIFNFAAMVDKIPSHCGDADVMSRNVGYWQSWSI